MPQEVCCSNTTAQLQKPSSFLRVADILPIPRMYGALQYRIYAVCPTLTNLPRGVNVGSVTSLTANTDETGRVYELIINGTGGTYTLKRQSTFTPFSSYGVKSQKYTLIPLTDSAPTAYAATSYGTYTLGGTYAITSGGVANVATGNYTMLSSSGYSTQQSGNITGYTFSGGGYGHGVGMSQYGAQGMASNGFTYDQILLHYYPGTYLESY